MRGWIKPRRKPDEEKEYFAHGNGRWITMADGSKARHVCNLPWSAQLGTVTHCPECRQIWCYVTDNIASCFWVHANPLKKLAYRFVVKGI